MQREPSPVQGSALPLLSVGCGVAVWLLYLLRAAPTTYLLDSSELVNATWSLGISHPPGHPAFHLLSYLAGLVPIGPFPWRIHLFAATCTALSVALLPLAADGLWPLRTRFSRFAAATLALAAGCSTALLLQSIRGEVYSLHLLVATAIITLIARSEFHQPRGTLVAAAMLGVGLLNHHYLTFFLFPGVALWVVFHPQTRGALLRTIAAACGIGGALVLGYAALLARGGARPHGSWAWPASLADLYWVVSAQAFQKTAAKVVTVDPATGFAKVAFLFMEQMGPVALALGVAGLGMMALRRRAIGLPLLLLLCFNIATQFIFDFDPWNPDVLGYFMTSVLLLALGCYGCIVWLAEECESSNIVRLTGVGLLPLTLLFWGVAEAADGRTRDLSRYRESEVLRDAVFREAPPDTLWVSAYFETGFQTWYGQGPEDQRPDVVHLHRSFRTYPHYDAMMSRSEPVLTPVLDAPAGTAMLSVPALTNWAERAAVRMEPDELVPPDELRHLVTGSAGLIWERDSATSSDRGRAAAVAIDAWERRFPSGSATELQTSRNIIWWSVGNARFLERTGHPGEADAFLALALLRSPEDPDLLALRQRLRRAASGK